MTWAAALSVVAAFLALAHVLKLPALARRAIGRGQRALSDLRDSSLDDLGKERAVRTHAGSLFGSFLLMTLLTAVAVGAPLLVVWLGDRAGVVSFDEVIDLTTRGDFLLVATVVGTVATLLLRWRRP